MTELLKQPQYEPMGIWEQVASLTAANTGLFDVVPADKIKDAQAALLTKLWDEHKDVMRAVNKGDKLSDETLDVIKKAAQKVAHSYAPVEEK